MGVDDNITLCRLPENLCQTYHMKPLRFYDIAKHAARTHAGKLVHISHQDKTRPLCHRFQQGMHQRDIHHRHLIHDNHIRLQRILLIALKSFTPVHAAVQFQHTVNRLRLKACCLTHPFCRAPGGSRQKNIHSFLFEITDNRVDGCRLSGSRSSGNHHQSIADCLPDCLRLQFIQLHSGIFLNGTNTALNLNLRYIIGYVQPPQHSRRIHFHIIKMGCIEITNFIHLFYHDLPPDGKVHIMFLYVFRFQS